MLKPILELIRHRGRGVKAPALLARPNRLVRRLGRASRGYVLAGAGVIAAAVTVVSLLSWLAPDSDRPIGYPLEVVERVLPGVLEQVDDQVAALLGADTESALREVREGLTAASSRVSLPGGRLGEIAPDRSSASSGSRAPASAARPTANTSPPAQESPSSPITNESPSQITREPSSPSSASPPSSASETETPPATESPFPTTGGPTPPPTATEEPSTPPAEELLPSHREPPTEEPPVEEVPPPRGPPPKIDEPAPPATEEPFPMPSEPPPVADQPPPPPPPPTPGHTTDIE